MKLSSRISNAGIAACVIILSLLAGCSGSSSLPRAATQWQLSPQSATQLPGAGQVDAYSTWGSSVTQTALPGAGCYEASYPSHTWTRIACARPPHLLYPLPASSSARAAALARQSVGNGNDFTADVKPHSMSEAVGTFPLVSGVTSVKSVRNPIFPCCGEDGTNSYTLQLNSYFFSTAACGTIKNCLGWEQFVYENPPGTSAGYLFIQDWLIPTTSSGLSGCPANKGWEFADGGCVQNSPYAVEINNISIKKLATLEEEGVASSTGDSIYLREGSTLFGLKNIQSDGITDLRGHWGGAEFNIIGNAGGDIADFNSGSTIEVRLEAVDGALTAPTCPANTGTTGESNNLNFVHAPSSPTKLRYPSILFTMSNLSGKGTASCDAVAAT